MILIPFIGEDDEETEKRERKFTFEGIYKWESARLKDGVRKGNTVVEESN